MSMTHEYRTHLTSGNLQRLDKPNKIALINLHHVMTYRLVSLDNTPNDWSGKLRQ